jgi:predicted RNase H-like HicB family nuclease
MPMEVTCMNKLFYPALFHEAEEGGFWVTFPDIPECMTQGDDMTQAYEMASEALGLSLSTMEDAQEPIPAASQPQEIAVEENSFLIVVEFDMAEYRRKHRSKAVKKTLSIPEWLNDIAVRQNINFSQVLQDALMEKVGAK